MAGRADFRAWILGSLWLAGIFAIPRCTMDGAAFDVKILERQGFP